MDTKDQSEPKSLTNEVASKYNEWREQRRPHERDWFVTAANVRGLQWVQWNDTYNQLQVKQVPQHRIRTTVNRMQPIYRTRQAKFLKNKFYPFIVPASRDREDKLDAEATQVGLEYVLRKERMEKKYREVLNWANIGFRGLVWLHWNPNAKATVKLMDPATGVETVQEIANGDVELEVGSPFELLPGDIGIPTLEDQDEIMRVKLRTVDEIVERFQVDPKELTEEGVGDNFQYQKQIASLSSRGSAGYAIVGATEQKPEDTKKWVLVKELFTRPCEKYPQGRYVAVAGSVVLKNDVLPYGFADTNHPFPVVEFTDLAPVGQFYGTTVMYQLLPLQKEYNTVRSQVMEHTRLMLHPKVIVPTQMQFPKNAWTSEPGEVVRVTWYPGLPPPQIINPTPISSDAWNIIRLVRDEMAEVSNIFPSAQGDATGTTSGFQVNLLQEASDSVHSPDVRLHEIAFEQLCYKIRRMMKMGYDVPRLLSIAGRKMLPQVLEFSADNIDENAEIVVKSSNVLASSPAVRTQQVIELFNAGILGDPKSPKTNTKALSLIDADGIGELQEETRRDEDLARTENNEIRKGTYFGKLLVTPSGMSFPEPMPWEDHDVHWTIHTDEMKTLEFKTWPEQRQAQLIGHLVWHAKYIDPFKAMELANQVGLPEIGMMIMDQMPPPQGAPQGAPQQPQPAVPPPQAAPPQAPPVQG